MREKLTTEAIRLAKIAADLDKQLDLAVEEIIEDAPYGWCAIRRLFIIECENGVECKQCWREYFRKKAVGEYD